MTTFTAPPSIIYAVDCLTRPLLTIYSPSTVFKLQRLLLPALSSAFSLSQRHQQPFMILTLAPGPVGPRVLYAPCIAAGIRWSDWMMVLGGTEFDMITQPTSVAVWVPGQRPTTLWSIPRPARNMTFASALEAIRPGALNGPLHSATPPRNEKTRTMAQELLDSPSEAQEAEELFACIAQASIIDPTPTPTPVPAMPIPATPAMSSVYPSRPSSRSSQTSSTCFSSISDETRTATVAGSVCALPLSPVWKGPIVHASVAAVSYARKVGPVPSGPVLPKAVPVQCPGRVAVPPPRCAAQGVQGVVVDVSKKEVMKYKYEGGVSTVLTGGVMLGGGGKVAPRSSPSGAVGGRRGNAPWKRV